MAVATTSGPQQQVNMPALDLRRFVGTGVSSEGVRTSSDLVVAQRGAGANMSVDVSAGAAYIQDDHAGGGGFYHGVWAATENVVVAASDPTNPRIDRVVARVRDQFLGDATNAIDIFVVTGTPTAGATLVNLNGAAAVPGSSLLLANVLVPAAAASVLTANIGNVAPLLKTAGSSSTTYRKATAKTVNTTVAATDLLNGEITIAAGAMGTTGILRLTAWGDQVSNAGGVANAQRFQLLFGGTTLFDTGVNSTLQNNASRYGWKIVVEIANLGAANSQVANFWGHLSCAINAANQNFFTTGNGNTLGSPTTATHGAIDYEGSNSSAVNTALATALVLNVINGSAAAGFETKLLGALVEIL